MRRTVAVPYGVRNIVVASSTIEGLQKRALVSRVESDMCSRRCVQALEDAARRGIRTELLQFANPGAWMMSITVTTMYIQEL